MNRHRLPDDVVYRPICNGVSLLNTSVTAMLQSTTTLRACAVKVVNHTRWTLESAGVYMRSGTLVTAQYSVKPGTAEAFVTEKFSGTATSCYGTASFEVKGHHYPRFITIMWSVPFDRIIYSTWLGIDISTACGQDDFDRMYSGRNKAHVGNFCRVFKGGLDPQQVHNSELKVRGIMGNGPKTEAIIDVYEIKRGN